jgi:hypothetical protein
VNFVEHKSNTNLDIDNVALSRIEAIETAQKELFLASEERATLSTRVNCVEHKSNTNLDIDNVALSRIEAIETAQAKDVTQERMTNIEEMYQEIREETVRNQSRLYAVEASFEQLMSSRRTPATENRRTRSEDTGGRTQARPIRPAKLPDDMLQTYSDLRDLQNKIKLARAPAKENTSNNSRPPSRRTRSESVPRSPRYSDPPVSMKTRSQPRQQENMVKPLTGARSTSSRSASPARTPRIASPSRPRYAEPTQTHLNMFRPEAKSRPLSIKTNTMQAKAQAKKKSHAW